MERKELSPTAKKNILDLHYNRYTQQYNTSIIILFTYFIGLLIALITRQVNIQDPRQLLAVGIATAVITSVVVHFLFNVKNHQHNIIKEIRKL